MTLFAATAARLPAGRSILVTPEATLDRDALLERVRRAAGWLRDAGVRPGQRVALQLPRSLAFLEVHLAALATGVSTLALNPQLSPHELRFLLGDAGATIAVVVDPALAGPRGLDAARLRAALDAAAPAPLPGVDGGAPPHGDAEALLLYTSGTTGRPKGARLLHRHVLACVAALHDAWAFTPDDILAHVLPLFHVHGLIVAQHVALHAGATTVWVEGDASTVARALAEHDATVFMGVPTHYHRLLALPEAPGWPRMRLFTSGSAPLPADLHRAFETRFGHRILERYGMTEIGIVLSNPLRGPRIPGSVGQPVRGVEVRIVDPVTGMDRPTGQIGEVWIRGPSVFEGYLARPDATAAALAGGWMHTGDLGRQDADGYVYLVGRRADLVIVGGFNVYPAEVEAALREHDAVEEVAVVGIPDPDLGERVVATVVARRPVEGEALRAFARARLSAYKVPRHVGFDAALPRNAMGKVQKDVLRSAWTRIEVGAAHPEEADRIASWNIAMARETEDLALEPTTARAGAAAVFARHDARYVVARVHGEPVAQAMVTVEWSDWRNTEVWWLQSVFVLPDWRGRGVFRAIFDHVLVEARAAGAAGLRLYVDRRNASARAIYEHLGMTADHYDCMERMLGEPA